MSIIAHVQRDETLVEKVLHPLTGIDHALAIAFVGLSIALFVMALRGFKAAMTTGAVTRVRSRMFVTASTILLGASILVLVAL